MSSYSSYTTNDFFTHQSQQSLTHLPQQQLAHQDPMIFHPAPTYYATNRQELIGYPPTHQDAATAFHFYQPNAESWPDSQLNVNYGNNQSFDYSGFGSRTLSASANELKHWSEQFAAPLLPNATEMLASLPGSTGFGVNANTLLSLDVQGRREQKNLSELALESIVTSNIDVKSIRPQRALNARQLQMQNPNAKIFTCNQCDRQYCRKSTLKAHMKQHNGAERQFVCEFCGKTFTQAANLTAHQRVHSGEKPFICNICLRPFSQSSSLVTHKRTHSGERPYPCSHCSKSFTDSSTLTKHMRTHSGIKPYSCHLCMMRFSQSGNLHRHLKTHRSPNTDN